MKEIRSIHLHVRIPLILVVLRTYLTMSSSQACCRRDAGQEKSNEVKLKRLKCEKNKVKGRRMRHKLEAVL